MHAKSARGMCLIGALVGFAVVATAAAQSVQQVDICHLTDTGAFEFTTVVAPAVPAHRNHGDALPGEGVPGQPGFIFDAACQEVRVSTCPCNFSPSFLATEGITSSTLQGGFCVIDPSGLVQVGDPSPQDFNIFSGLVGASCAVVFANQTLQQGDVSTAGEAQDCANDLQSAAQVLGLTCQLN